MTEVPQLRVDVPDADAGQTPVLDQGQNLNVRRDGRLREISEQTNDLTTLGEAAERELPCHQGVRQYVAVLEQPYEPGITGAEVVDPDRCVDEDHASVVCRRGTGCVSGSVPPS